MYNTGTGYSTVSTEYTSLLPQNFIDGYSISIGGDELSFIPVDAESSYGTLNSDNVSIDYINTWTSTDVNLKATDNGIKETIILKDATSPCTFSFLVTGNLGQDLAAGKLMLEPAWLMDANGVYRDVAQTVRQVGGSTYLDLKVDVSGLTYPIMIDPTVKLQPNYIAVQDAYVSGSISESALNFGVIDPTNLRVGPRGPYRSYIQFDLSSISDIPSSSIVKANFALCLTYSSNTESSFVVSARKVTQQWNENTINWNNKPNTTSTGMITQYINYSNAWQIFDIFETLNEWLSGASENYGIEINWQSALANTYSTFASSSHNIVKNRPRLTIIYNTLPTAPIVLSPESNDLWGLDHTISWSVATDASDIISYDKNIFNTVGDPYSSIIINESYKVGQTLHTNLPCRLLQFAWRTNLLPADYSYSVSIYNVSGKVPEGSPIFSQPFTNATAVNTPTTITNNITGCPVLNGNATYAIVLEPHNPANAYILTHIVSSTHINEDNLIEDSNLVSKNNLNNWQYTSNRFLDSLIMIDRSVPDLHYNIECSIDNGATYHYTICELTDPGVTSYTYDFSSIPQTIEAKLRIRAWDGYSYGPWDESEIFTIQHDITPPELTFTQNINDWTKENVTITATAIDSGSGVNQIQLPNGTWVQASTAHYTVSENGTYIFKATDNMGNSTTRSITIENIDTTTNTVPSVKLTPGIGSIKLSWDSISNATGYEVEIDGVITDNGTSTVYESTFDPGIDHYFRVRAINTTGTSEWSNILIGQAKYALPPTPANLTTIPAGTFIEINWNEVTGALGYDLELDGELYKGGIATTYTHTGLKLNTQHAYRVRARNIQGAGEWSPLVTAMTTASLPAVPTDIIHSATNTTITLNWTAAADAETYDIVEVINGEDGRIVDNETPTTCEKRGLNPSSTYTYKIRGVNSLGPGDWSAPITVTTYYLDTPSGILTEESDTSIILTWNEVENAGYYLINLNDSILLTSETNTYTLTDLTPETKYTFTLKAVCQEGQSGESSVITIYTTPIKPAVPQNVNATVSDTRITITWDAVDSAEGYDVELDGILMEDDDDPIYIHEELESDTLHAYKVRARNAAIEGDWSDLQYIMTLPGKPIPPREIEVKSSTTGAALTWSKKNSDLSFDLEINDGTQTTVVTDIAKNNFIHRRTALGQEYTYRIRTKNIQGVSDWSGKIINNALKAWCQKAKTVDLGLTAKDVTDFSPYTMVVTYNATAIDVIDLSTLTGKYETEPGRIEGTDIQITDFSPGRITFVVDKVVNPGEAWTGVLNSIRFKAKATGGTTITYTVFSKPEIGGQENE